MHPSVGTIFRTVLVLAALLAGAASAFPVEEWVEPPLPPLEAAALLFGDGVGEEAGGWPEPAAPPWYYTDECDPVALRRNWIDLGEQDALRVRTAVTHIVTSRYGEVTFHLTCVEAARLSLDGEVVLEIAAEEAEGEHSIVLPRGKSQVMVEVRAAVGRRARFKLDVASDQAVTVSTVSARLLSRFEDTRLVPSISDLAISPDGNYLLVLHRDRDADGESSSRLVLHSLATGRKATIVEGSASRPDWLSDQRFTYRSDGVLIQRDLRNGHQRRLLDDVEGLGQYDIGAPVFYIADPGGDDSADSDTCDDDDDAAAPRRLTELRERLTDWSDTAVLYVRHGLSDLARTQALTAVGDFHVTSFAVHRGDAGARLAVVRKVPMAGRPFFSSEIWVMNGDGSDPRLVQTVTTGFEIWPMNLAWSPDGTRIAYTGSRNEVGAGQPERNWADTDVWLLDAATGESRNLTADIDAAPQDRDGAALTWLDDRTLIFAVDAGHGGRMMTLDVITRSTSTFGEDGTVGRPTVAVPGRTVAWIHASLDTPARVALHDLDEGASRRLPGARHLPFDVAGSEPFVFTNSAGDEIDGWLTRPLGGPGAQVPLIVYYYGGATSTMGGFNTTHQWLAANGYAVYVINPRGAGTYGQEFADHHVNDWGRKSPSDVIEGVAALLAAHPELDRDRVGCYGGSYGGFMTMSLLTQTDIFAAGVSMYGISNLASYWGEGIWGYTYGDMAMADSYPWNDPELYADRSPLYHADKVTTPLLLLHGADDANVPPGESEQMFTALKVLGREVELVRFAGEDHGISGTWRNRVAHRTMMLEWFDRWLKDQPEAWEARWADGD